MGLNLNSVLFFGVLFLGEDERVQLEAHTGIRAAAHVAMEFGFRNVSATEDLEKPSRAREDKLTRPSPVPQEQRRVGF